MTKSKIRCVPNVALMCSSEQEGDKMLTVFIGGAMEIVRTHFEHMELGKFVSR